MVRKVMRYALLAAALCLVVGPARALADEEAPVLPVQDFPDYSTRLDTLSGDIERLRTTVDSQRVEQVQHLQTIELLLTPSPQVEEVSQEQPADENESKQLEKLDKLNKNVEKLVEIESESTQKTEEVTEEEQQPTIRARRISYTAYSNVPPTGTYAQYAAGLLPKMGFGEHYAYLQDSSSSYVLVIGNLIYSSGSITGTGKYWRWYYANNVTGYVMEQGSGDVTIDTNSKTVLSDLDGYPMLILGDELLRREVGFYAVVAVSVFCLASVLGFVVRLRGAVTY